MPRSAIQFPCVKTARLDEGCDEQEPTMRLGEGPCVSRLCDAPSAIPTAANVSSPTSSPSTMATDQVLAQFIQMIAVHQAMMQETTCNMQALMIQQVSFQSEMIAQATFQGTTFAQEFRTDYPTKSANSIENCDVMTNTASLLPATPVGLPVFEPTYSLEMILGDGYDLVRHQRVGNSIPALSGVPTNSQLELEDRSACDVLIKDLQQFDKNPEFFTSANLSGSGGCSSSFRSRRQCASVDSSPFAFQGQPGEDLERWLAQVEEHLSAIAVHGEEENSLDVRMVIPFLGLDAMNWYYEFCDSVQFNYRSWTLFKTYMRARFGSSDLELQTNEHTLSEDESQGRDAVIVGLDDSNNDNVKFPGVMNNHSHSAADSNIVDVSSIGDYGDFSNAVRLQPARIWTCGLPATGHIHPCLAFSGQDRVLGTASQVRGNSSSSDVPNISQLELDESASCDVLLTPRLCDENSEICLPSERNCGVDDSDFYPAFHLSVTELRPPVELLNVEYSESCELLLETPRIHCGTLDNSQSIRCTSTSSVDCLVTLSSRPRSSDQRVPTASSSPHINESEYTSCINQPYYGPNRPCNCGDFSKLFCGYGHEPLLLLAPDIDICVAPLDSPVLSSDSFSKPHFKSIASAIAPPWRSSSTLRRIAALLH